ncbi:MAG: NAD(+) synthase [Oscillospiraceae bacterium]|nr:NAD(+) synthase [Oscillospiraceae bacterium]
MLNCEQEIKDRVSFIRSVLERSGAKGIVYGNSGGKDSALVGILCKMACSNTVGVIMPCSSAQNYGSDRDDALAAAAKFNIETRTVDLSDTRQSMLAAVGQASEISPGAVANIPPRLRMICLYAIAASEGRLVAGTGNKNEYFMGYFTKWGDGAYDFNPISDLTVDQIYELLTYLGAPESIITKAPSAGLFDGQTDEKEMGVTYAAVTDYMNGAPVSGSDALIIERYHSSSEHKRQPPLRYSE